MHAVDQLGTILGVWAHPDDETYLSAGLMAAAVAAGQRVVLVHATRGESGTSDPMQSGRSFAALRERELAAARAVLGVTEQRFLGYEDGRCSEIPLGEGTRAVAGIIAAVKPDTIVTFGPDGITGHPDHLMVSAWTTAAWLASDRTATLLYATTTDTFADEFAAFHEALEIFPPGLPVRTPRGALAMHLELPPELLARKRAALAAHASQTTELAAAFGEENYLRWFASESFTQAA
jgi:LmbE family N-acetylglucosaminyl deacetylase